MTEREDIPERGLATLSNGGRIAYEIHGREHAGAPLLLIRPLAGTMALWGDFRAQLATKLRVISFDRRGFGRSSACPGWVSTLTLARDSLELLDRLAVPRAHVFGISLGGMIATWLAILAQDRVMKLCVAAAPECGREFSWAGLRRELALASCFARAEPDVEPALVKHVLSSRFVREHADEAERFEEVVRCEPTARATLFKHACAGVLHAPHRELDRIRSSTLVLAGRDDDVLGLGPARRLADAISHACFESIDGSGHDLTLEQPRVTAARLVQFVSA
jgi:pimeloyl-ACP methyl ester carboxylesterase